ncbi:flagellar hook-associated protein FlgK [Candidatus Galacturonibacter soehngenii]|uniref:Flagellar hook-associated protein 1 n=1 Tax=Candidatus Galacturonatibacter soehngenii TaxID=2307010 RepID=A0A7V7UAK5_9FIRM|nr:flagellar hook-associated protein FlgK [Candidatus Galacturonibacter soehngenii]KAB1434320.1 flagellar hook-associated protein FlgK [Candidatus Galacturonibacter soehngenii]MBA4686662.1 flagellar hook-associated protein FlgK [Candidatus Galacturonibacter soehngenii]
MPSTFLGLTIATSGLYTYQTQISVTGNNVANVETDGYTRQSAKQTPTEALRAYATYGQIGMGVQVTGIEQIRNSYYDSKYWSTNTGYGEYSTKNYYMEQLQYLFHESKKTSGYVSALNTFFNSMQEAAKTPLEVSTLTQFVNDAQTFAEYFNDLSTNLEKIQEDLNEEVKTYVDKINGIAQQIYSLNQQINVSELAGGNASALRDQRALLIDELSEIVPVEVNETEILNSQGMKSGATNFAVSILGQKLVDNDSYNELECVARTDKVNQSDVEGLYDVKWTSGNQFNVLASGASGKLKALIDLRDGNNANNFSGKIQSITPVDANNTKVTITSLTYSNLEQLNLNGSGTIKLGTKEYSYDSFAATYNSATGEYEYTFNITSNNTTLTPSMVGKTAEVGRSVDFCGIPYYMSQINEFARNFAKTVNNILITGFNVAGDVGGILYTGTSVTGAEYDFALSGAVASITQAGGISSVSVVADNGETATPQATGSIYINGVKYDYDSYSYDPATKMYTYQIKGSVSSSLVGKNADNYTLVQDNREDSYYYLTAANLKVSSAMLKNPLLLGTTTKLNDEPSSGNVLYKLYEAQNNTSILSFRGGDASRFLICLVSDTAVDAQKSTTFSGKYDTLLKTITNQRLSVSGVDGDEEAVNLMKFKNAYDLSCKLVTVMQQMYDKLINETGV